jgi:hypothetical protein
VVGPANQPLQSPMTRDKAGTVVQWRSTIKPNAPPLRTKTTQARTPIFDKRTSTFSEHRVADPPIAHSFKRARRSTGTARSAWRRRGRRLASTTTHAGQSLRPGTTVSLADSCLCREQSSSLQTLSWPARLPTRRVREIDAGSIVQPFGGLERIAPELFATQNHCTSRARVLLLLLKKF